MTRKKAVLHTLIPLLLLLTIVLVPRPAKAVDACGNSVFQFKKRIFCAVTQSVQDIDITRTVGNMVNELLTGFPSQLIYARNADELGTCALAAIYMCGNAIPPFTADRGCGEGIPNVPIDESDRGITSTTDLAALSQEAYEEVTNNMGGWDAVCDMDVALLADGTESRNQGSLAAVGMSLHKTAGSPDLPVNLAYYFKDVTNRIPIVNNTALAQTFNYNYTVGLELVYNLWTLTRNVAYGIIGVAMTVIGMMIMSRKNINPQVSVTVQNALPRVIIALILITFSYPIGAIILSMVVPLIAAVAAAFTAGTIQNVISATNLATLAGIIVSAITVGPTALVVGSLISIVTLVLFIIAVLRMIFIYAKMIIQIVIAPLVFAMGAIPGNEEQTTKWFKNMVAHLLSIPAMYFAIVFGWYVIEEAIVNFANYTSGGSIFGNAFPAAVSQQITIMFIPMIAIAVMGMSLSVPGKVRGMIVGKERK